jgi:hypothetical protein
MLAKIPDKRQSAPSGSGFPFFTFFLILLIIFLVGAVGYLAYPFLHPSVNNVIFLNNSNSTTNNHTFAIPNSQRTVVNKTNKTIKPINYNSTNNDNATTQRLDNYSHKLPISPDRNTT